MQVATDFDINTFEFWSGARDTILDIEAAGKMKEFEFLLESVFSDHVPTETEINDYVWFDRDQIYDSLGLDPDGHLIED